MTKVKFIVRHLSWLVCLSLMVLELGNVAAGAEQPEDPITVREYDVNLRIDYESRRIFGSVTYQIKANQNVDHITLSGGSATRWFTPADAESGDETVKWTLVKDNGDTVPIVECRVNGRPTDFTIEDEKTLSIELERTLQADRKVTVQISFVYDAAYYKKYGFASGFRWQTMEVDENVETVALYLPAKSQNHRDQQFLFPGFYEGQEAHFKTKLELPKRICGLVTGDFKYCRSLTDEVEVLAFESPKPTTIQQWAFVVGLFDVLKVGKVSVVIPYYSDYLVDGPVFDQVEEVMGSLEEPMAIYSAANPDFKDLYLVLMTDGYDPDPEKDENAGFLTGNFAMMNNAIAKSGWLKLLKYAPIPYDKSKLATAIQAANDRLRGDDKWRAVLMPSFSEYRELVFDKYKESVK